MPELPEVETVAQGLRYLEGRRLERLEIFDAKVWFESELAPEALQGKRLLAVSRRGKYLLLRFEGGLTLVEHLRMTGKMLAADSAVIPVAVRAAVGKAGKGLQLRCRFRFGAEELFFFDTRRFGTLSAIADEEAFFLRKGIAPDPIAAPELALPWFLERLASTKKPVKAALLDQSIVAGVGNIYADEALHAAQLDPRLPAHSVPSPERLWREILRLLQRSITMGGTTVYDYVNADGKKGGFGSMLLVYDREGEACRSCQGLVERIQLAGRSTHFCPVCQPLRSSGHRAKTGRSKVARGAGKRGSSRR